MEKTCLINGKINSGKTTGIIYKEVEEFLASNENILILDPKEEYLNQFNEELKDYNKVIINLKNNDLSNNYNPFLLPYKYYKEGNKDTCIELLERICKTIFIDDNSIESDPFWTNSACDLCMSLMLIIMEHASSKQVNLGSLSLALDGLLEKDLIKEYFDKLDKTSEAFISGSSIIYAPLETRTSIISVSKQKLKEYTLRPSLLALTNLTNFEIKEKTAIIIVLNQNLKNRNNLGNMLIEEIYFRTKTEELKMNFILDNIDFINKLDCLTSLINNPKNNLIIASRDLDNLKNVYPKGTFNVVLEEKTALNEELVNQKKAVIKFPKTKITKDYFEINKYLSNE
ncbi:MAG: hypothetical protein RSA15_05025 [Bacilli bacterium]